MQDIRIISLRLKNFKGIQEFTLAPGGEDITVSGDNATGKTSLVDAFTWLLFGKDSAGRADFQLKPVTAAGEEIHNLETEVEAEMDFNGKSIRLKKVYQEKYTKKRGQAISEFTGHTTDHFIDDVPVSKKDFDGRVADLIDINVFKLVSSPYEFASLHWTARRNLLLEICGDVSDLQVIESDPALAKLKEILAGCSMEDHRAKIKARQVKINKDLREIPGRISENQNIALAVSRPDPKELDRLNALLEEETERLRALESNEAISQKQIRVNEIQAELIQARSDVSKALTEERKPIQAEMNRLEDEERVLTNNRQIARDRIKEISRRIEILKSAIEATRKKWDDEAAKQVIAREECPTCGQALPEEQIEITLANFNRAKAERLEAISREGKDTRQTIEAFERDLETETATVEALTARITELRVQIKDVQAKLDSHDSPAYLVFRDHIDDSKLSQEKIRLNLEIEALRNGSQEQRQEILSRIAALKSEVDQWQKAMAEWEASDKARTRIDELQTQEKTLAAAYEALEAELALTDRFIIRKVEMLEGAINGKFKLARFKLFADQINGGLAECCEILFEGVPFDRGLNSAARINTGLDIISRLSEHYQFRAPVWIDNKESVNDLLPIEAQVISLAVSRDKELTVTSAETEIKKAS